MTKQNQEPPDHHRYSWISLYADTFKFFRRSVQFYIRLLEAEGSRIEEDEDLQWLLTQGEQRKTALVRELDRAKRVEGWIQRVIEEGGGENASDYDLDTVSHELIRFLKTAAIIYLQYLKNKRNTISSKSDVSKFMLESVDSQLSTLEEKVNVGVFAQATPFTTLVDEILETTEEEEKEKREDSLVKVRRPKPVIIDTIQILDSELRERCLDLFASFQEDGSHERLDTVIAEATRILETRLRALAKANQTCVGVDLARAAFAGTPPSLKVSDVAAEQEAAHLLYRGTFGFIRNQVQHRLLGELNPERVLQVLGMIDYLLYVAENAAAGPSRS